MLAFATFGVGYDIESFRLTGQALLDDPTQVYETMRHPPNWEEGRGARWPYPSGTFPWMLLAHIATNGTPLPFHGVIHLPMIAADAALAVLVALWLRRRGATERRSLTGAGLVALGPSFVLISGYHGQLESLAVLPGVLALWAWERKARDRAWTSGALVGLGAAVKTFPIALLLALVPTARSRREALRTVGWAATILLLAVGPFLVATPGATVNALRYTGVPGVGGLGLVLQPSLAGYWILGFPFDPSELTLTVARLNTVLLAIVGVGVGALLLYTRPRPVDGAVLVWLAVYAFVPSFFFHYLLWGLPFFLLAGYLKEVAALQALVLVPTLLGLLRPWDEPLLLAVYVPLMILVWCGFLVAFVRRARALVSQHRRGGAAAGPVRPGRLTPDEVGSRDAP